MIHVRALLRSPVWWETSMQMGLLRALVYTLDAMLMCEGTAAGHVASPMGDDYEDVARQGPGEELRDWAQQGHRRHHEAHRQDQPHHQRHCLGLRIVKL